MSFRKDFMWGAATASAQIEGGYLEDGKGLSLWDVMYKDHVKHNDSPHIACDHYHHLEEDVKLMQEIGLKYYRFSISWPRILPNGTGTVNEKGIAFYSRLLELLKKAGIEPLVTLYHWDLPYELYKRGGWQNPESIEWFCEYTKVVIENFSDKVKFWLTFNEPNCFVGLGYETGVHAPFIKDKDALYECTRNVLKAHSKAVRIIRENAIIPPKIGFAPTGPVYIPENDTSEKIEKARTNTFSNLNQGAFSVGWWIDPVVLGQNPQNLLEYFGKPLFSDEELSDLKAPLDFLGFNIYFGVGVQSDNPDYESNEYAGSPRNALGWPITPECIYWAVRFLQDRYKLPVLITENGMCNLDFVMMDGKVHDPQRIDYVQRHLLALKKAVDEGYDVLGYMYWSLMDNYEWAEGYSPRFGLVYVDYRTQRRALKDSALWYRDVIAANGENL